MREHTSIPDNKEVRTSSQVSFAPEMFRFGLFVIFSS